MWPKWDRTGADSGGPHEPCYLGRFRPNHDHWHTGCKILHFFNLWSGVKLLLSGGKLVDVCIDGKGVTNMRVKICRISQVTIVTCDRTATDLWPRHSRLSFLSLSTWNSVPSTPNHHRNSVMNLRLTLTNLQPTRTLGTIIQNFGEWWRPR